MAIGQVHDVKMSDIEISEFNVRQSAITHELDELAASIKENGLMQPVVLVGEPGRPKYKLIAGQRRYLAHEKLKRKKIKAVFIAEEMSDEEIVLLSLTENMQAVDLNHADTMRAVRRLYDAFGQDERKVQKKTGLPLQRIRSYLSIESQASPKIMKMIEDKQVTTADVKRALRAAQSNIKKAERLLSLMSKYELTKHQKKRIVDFGEENKSATADTILKEAIKPRVEQNLLVSLPEEIRAGLESATKELSMEAEDIVSDVLEEWLSEQGFLSAA